jgi:hypothetical protein
MRLSAVSNLRMPEELGASLLTHTHDTPQYRMYQGAAHPLSPFKRRSLDAEKPPGLRQATAVRQRLTAVQPRPQHALQWCGPW